jgi:hypothetical protein
MMFLQVELAFKVFLVFNLQEHQFGERMNEKAYQVMNNMKISHERMSSYMSNAKRWVVK